ncbi:hypothetical protein ARTHRO9V_230077 [Arthrobacter sp. 9V]|nr:hypothetical protein ARTHRO9V_230077 [Arthrobacter sp. 9V]
MRLLSAGRSLMSEPLPERNRFRAETEQNTLASFHAEKAPFQVGRVLQRRADRRPSKIETSHNWESNIGDHFINRWLSERFRAPGKGSAYGPRSLSLYQDG